MAKILIPSSLRKYVNNEESINEQGDTITDILQQLSRKHKQISKYIFTKTNELHPFMNIFLDEKHIRDIDGLNTPISETSIIRLLPAIAGG
jgi:adenylyltransferase/sulfurtransferase